MKIEDCRVATLVAFPADKATPAALAGQGFYYRGYMDYVACAFCSEQFAGWDNIEHLLRMHKADSQTCIGPHNNTENTPIGDQSQGVWQVPAHELALIPPPHLLPSMIAIAKPSCFREETARLQSFIDYNWTLLIPNPEHLAMYGFYMCRDGSTRCAFCTVRMQKWRPEDHPIQAHLRINPTCPNMCNPDVTNNVPRVTTYPRRDERAPFDGNVLTRVTFEQSTDNLTKRIQHLLISSAINGDITNTGINMPIIPRPLERAFTAHMNTYISRLRTYNDCRTVLQNDRQQLARAGFYYALLDNIIRCFYCNGTFEFWVSGLNPWKEHAKYFPECEFLRHHQGIAFIEQELEQVSADSNNTQPMDNDLGHLLSPPFSCKVCGKDAQLHFEECQHICVCIACAPDISTCPICNVRVVTSHKAFV
jgi:hypothetical protein